MTNNRNIFGGEGKRAKFASAVYSRYMTREWFTYADVMSDCDPKFDVEHDKRSSHDNYDGLKHGFKDVRDAIKEKCGESVLEESGNNKCKQYRYSGELDDPLRDLLEAEVIRDIKTYWAFCQDTAGFIPMEWIEYFFEGTKDLLNIKKVESNGEKIIYASSVNMDLKNKKFLPSIYESIKKRQVIKVKYQPYGKPANTLTVSPHVLSEYNGRWFLLCQDIKGKRQTLAVDRIDTFSEVKGHEYVEAQQGFYSKFFESRVGVSDKDEEKVEDVHIRAYSGYMFHLLETKRLHGSQETCQPYDEEKGYGEFVVRVVVNNEFIGRVLQMGGDLEVMSPDNVRQIFRDKVNDMLSRYGDEH